MGSRSLVILAAGRSERFGSPKQLASVGPDGETLMACTIGAALRVGFEQVVIVTRPDLGAALRRIHRGPSIAVEIVYQAPDQPGTVPAVVAARSCLGDDEPFVVVNGDDLYSEAALAALRSWPGPGHAVAAFPLAATILPGSRPVNRALCQVGDDGRLVNLVEASVHEVAGGFMDHRLCSSDDLHLPGDQLVSMNGWALAPCIWPHLESALASPGEVLLPVVIGALAADGVVTVTCLAVAGRCVGITWPEDVVILRDYLAREHERSR